MAETTPEAAWAAAFVAAQAELKNPTKNKKVQVKTKDKGTYSYNYAELSDIIDQVRPVLAKHGLAFAQGVVREEQGHGITMAVYHKAGHVEWFGPLVLAAADGPQAVGSSITYARRYLLCAVLGIAAEEDDDAASVGAGSGPAAHDARSPRVPASTPTEKAVASAETIAARKQVEDLRKELGWAPSKVLAFIRKAGVDVSSSKVAEWDETAVETTIGLLTGEVLKQGSEADAE